MNYYLENLFYKFAGMLFLFLAKCKYLILGYSTPRPFAVDEYERAIIYDVQVVRNWLSYIQWYSGKDISLQGKEVLELGPGADLGVGLYLLALKATRYSAVDINNLVASVPQEFYESFFRYIGNLEPNSDINFLRQQLLLTQRNQNDRLNYIYRADFNIEAVFLKNSFDIIFSQAAFEHFDNIEESIRQLSLVAKQGTILISEIDLKTHSRWIRDKDPNNIYRYSEQLYRLFSFRGAPNRNRPRNYEEILRKNGWNNIVILPLCTVPEVSLKKILPFLSYDFRAEENQMQILSCVICATKSD